MTQGNLNAQAVLFCQQEAAQPPFPTEERVEARVGKTPYVRFDRNDYSVPHTAVRRTLSVLALDDTVRILDCDTVVAVHPRSYSQSTTVECPDHIEALRQEKHKLREPATLRRLQKAAPAAQDFLTKLAAR